MNNFKKLDKLAFKINNNWTYYYPIPSSDISSTYWNGLAGFIGRFTDSDRTWATNGIPINVGSNGITNFLEDKAIGHTNGLEILQTEDSQSQYTQVSDFGQPRGFLHGIGRSRSSVIWFSYRFGS